MKFNKLFVAFVFISILNMPQAYASIINNDTYTTDTESGLDWLDIDSSLGRSRDDVASQFGIGGDFEGFRYATGDEFNELIGNYLNTTITGYDAVNHGEDAELSRLIELLCKTSCLTLEDDLSGAPGAMTHRFEIFGLIGDQDSAGNFWVSNILGEIRESVTFPESNFSAAHGVSFSGDRTQSYVGSFLIRPTVIPIPGSIYLLGSALFGLFTFLALQQNLWV